VEATRVVVVLVSETSTQKATVAWDSTTKAEREAQERVSSVEAENAAALDSAHDDAEGLI
jgi:hypothetical protein